VAGVYVAVSRPGQKAADDRLTVDVPGVNVTTTPGADPSQEQALTAAQQKAAAAAADAADLAKRADEAAKRTAEQAASRSQTRTQAPYPVPSSCSDYSGNRALGCAVLRSSGFGLDQMPCLDKLFTRESQWNPKARNRSSGAYGIPQALPGSKMAAFGADWETNPVTQVKWGLSYIKTRYKTPCGAWAHSQANGWY
jgi:Transglycosylase SLT domain